MTSGRAVRAWTVVACCLLVAGCGVSGDDEGAGSATTASTTADASSSTTADTGVTTTSPPSTTTTTAPTTTAPATTTTTAAGTSTSTSPTGPAYGDPCDLGSHPDCIDPDGDGQGTYLEGGAACMAEMAPTLGPGICTDLDGDGRAGYPDAG